MSWNNKEEIITDIDYKLSEDDVTVSKRVGV